MSDAIRVVHVATVDLSLRYLLLGQLLHLREAGFDVSAISAPGPWVAGLQAVGIRHLAWKNATRSWDLAADARACSELLGIFRRERFQLVHTHNPKPGVLGRTAARMAGVPCVANTVHGLYATPDDRLAKKVAVLGVEALAARLSDLELYQSEEDLDWARRAHVVAPARSVLLGNGIDVREFAPGQVTNGRRDALRAELGIPAGSLVVGTVGRLVAEKGYRELFAAAADLRSQKPGVRFLAVGEIELEKADTIRENELAAAGEHVIFAGWREDVRDLLGVMDVFVLPSWREGMPRSAIEAAAMGLPMVLTDIRGCREVARDGREAILVPPRDAMRLARAIALLLDRPMLRARLGAAARARAVERFDERNVFEIVVREYRRLLSRRGLRPPS
jgi:glycosyltransferase involved in cell wall biosynthesis